ncbi:acyl-CoA synthetase (AMP-forming)/AMP-acid ligase II [Actinobacteria bacterium IMCC26256]|nr:acyl-CoA synthetase (AMP-forming)/AMP-acid ligase II [Actinobacteria bacterium IMCC26256]
MLLHEIIERSAKNTPDAPAVIVEGEVVTFSELEQRVKRLANAVASITQRHERIAFLSENTLEFADAYYAIARVRRILVPLNYRLNPREWVEILHATQARVVIGERALLDALEPHLPKDSSNGGTQFILIEIGGDCAAGRVAFNDFADGSHEELEREIATDPEETAWILFTSGTTGIPKGAMLPHRALIAAAENTALGRRVAEDDVYFLAFALCHVAGYNLLIMHSRARPVVLVKRFEADEFLTLTKRHGVTNTSLAPTMVSTLLEHPEADGEALATLRQIAYGSSSVPAEILRRAMQRWGCDFAQGYGMTELGGNAVFMDGHAHRRGVTTDPHLLTAAGKPGPLAEARIVDDAMVELPMGEVGEIVIRGAQVFSGYWNDPESTAETIIDGWLRTGDLGFIDSEGFISVVDRKKDVIVTGGENVASREVEEVLHRHPGVLEVAVVGVPDEHWGEAVCAAIVPRSGVEVTSEEIVALAKDYLASYKKPRHVVLVESLPRNTSGKVMKHVLRDQVAEILASR